MRPRRRKRTWRASDGLGGDDGDGCSGAVACRKVGCGVVQGAAEVSARRAKGLRRWMSACREARLATMKVEA